MLLVPNASAVENLMYSGLGVVSDDLQGIKPTRGSVVIISATPSGDTQRSAVLS
jgi:hypothetical protein